MLNIEKYKDEIIAEWRESEEDDLLEDIKSVAHRHGSKGFTCERLMDWLCEEYQEPLLNDEEKEFIRDLKKWYKFDAIKVSFPYIDLLVKKKSKDGSTRYVLVHSIPFFDGSSMFKGLVNSNLTVFPLEKLGL